MEVHHWCCLFSFDFYILTEFLLLCPPSQPANAWHQQYTVSGVFALDSQFILSQDKHTETHDGTHLSHIVSMSKIIILLFLFLPVKRSAFYPVSVLNCLVEGKKVSKITLCVFQEWTSSDTLPEPQSDGAQADTSAGECLHELHQGDQAAELWDGEPGPRHQTVTNISRLGSKSHRFTWLEHFWGQ